MPGMVLDLFKVGVEDRVDPLEDFSRSLQFRAHDEAESDSEGSEEWDVDENGQEMEHIFAGDLSSPNPWSRQRRFLKRFKTRLDGSFNALKITSILEIASKNLKDHNTAVRAYLREIRSQK